MGKNLSLVLDEITLQEVQVLAWYLHQRDRSLTPNLSGTLRLLIEGAISGRKFRITMKRAWGVSRVTNCTDCKSTHAVPYCFTRGQPLTVGERGRP
jgi:hypothetical protein